jgi:ArsR family transcriptional regulator
LIKLLEKHQGALCVNALAKHLGISQSAVSQHLRVLRGIQLVEADRQGPMVHYSINKHKISEYTSLRQEVFGIDFL